MEIDKMNGRTSRRYAGIAATVALLAAGGVGTYQLTSTRFGSSNDADINLADSRPLRVSDAEVDSTLDAVTRAWEAESSVAAASVTTVETMGNSAQPISTGSSDELYSLAETRSVPAKPTPLETNEVDESAVLGSRYAMTDVPIPAESQLSPVARGQEPSDDERGPSDIVNPFDNDSDDPALEQRARAAFATSTDDSRYGIPSEPVAEAAVSPKADDPFGVQPPGPLPVAGAYARSIKAPRPSQVTESHRTVPDYPQPNQQSSTTLQNAGSNPVAPPVDFNPDPQPNPYSRGTGHDSGFDLSPETSRFAGSLETESRQGEGIGRPGESALEGPQNPALSVEKLAPQEIQVGKPATFRIAVRNTGNRPAAEVVVRDEIPQGTHLISTTPRAEEVDGHIVWQLGTLSVGEQRDLQIELMPTAEGQIGSVATITYAAQASVKTNCTLPQLALRLKGSREVMIGDEQRVKIELHNPGSGDATGVMLYENVPEELRHNSGPALEFEIGTLRSGETREIELVLTAERPGIVVNRISARADGNLQVEQEIEFEVVAPALEVNVEGPRVRYLERPATYMVEVGNPGTAVAKDIELVTKLPKGLQFVRANNLGEYDAEAHAVYWSLAELPQGERGSVELVALPIESGEHEIRIEGKARQGLEDHTTQHVVVDGLAAIMFEVADLKDPIEVGGETTYEIRVVNQGSKAATGVQVKASVPSGMQIVSATGDTRHVFQSGAVIFEPLSRLAPKADTLYRLQVKGVSAGDQRLLVEVDTEDIGQPIRKEESTRVFGDE